MVSRCVAVVSCLLLVHHARAETLAEYSTSFEAAEGYTLGSIDGQNGWSVLNPTDYVTAIVQSSVSETGAMAVVISNAFLATDYTLTLRRSIPAIAVKTRTLESAMSWTSLTGDISSDVAWKLYSSGSTYVSLRSSIKANLNGMHIDYRVGGRGSNSSPAPAVPDYLRWNRTSSVFTFGKVLTSGESISPFYVSIANATGEWVAEDDLWVKDFSFTAVWVDFEISVRHQSSVAIDNVSFAITSENQQPTDILLSHGAVPENQSPGTSAGTLSTVDADAADTFTYDLVAGIGDADNGSFSISGSNLLTTASFDYETKSNYIVRVASTDAGGLSTQKVFTVYVDNVDETPMILGLNVLNPSNCVIRWSSITNHFYTVRHSTNLTSGFSVRQTDILATPPVNSYTDSVNEVLQKFWQVTTIP